MPETQERRTQAERRETTERRVLDAAIELIARRGSHGVSLAEVGRLAGYSRGIVNHHFGSRRELLEAVVLATQRFEVAPFEGAAAAHLQHFARSYLGSIAARDQAARAFLVLWAESAAADPVLEPLFRERDASFRGFLADLAREGREDGSMTTDLEADGLAAVVVGLLRGTAMQLLSRDVESTVVIDTAMRTIALMSGAGPGPATAPEPG